MKIKIQIHKAMKKITSFLFAIATMAFLLQGCNEKPEPPAPLVLEEVVLSMDEAVMKKGETLSLTYTLVPEEVSCEQVLWLSSEPSVATVDQEGNVTAVSTGTAEITLTIDSKSDVCKVTVDPVLPQDIVFDVTEHRLLVGGSFKINATVLPEDADDKSLEWSSSDESVAVVADDGTVSAVAAGSAVITALCGEITAECVVTVIPMPQLGDYYYSDGTWSTELDASKETIGLVFYITPDYTSGKILSLDEFYNPEGGEYASYTKWCTGEMEYVGCSHEFEGRLNMEIMKEHPGWEENYPPFKWCADKTDGGLEWYLPATAELRQMLCGMVGYKWMNEGAEEENNEINDWGDNERYLNGSEYADEKEAFNARVVAAGGEPLECGGNMYWASNEQDANYAGKIVFLTGMTQGFKKSDPYGRVRPIAIFTIE